MAEHGYFSSVEEILPWVEARLTHAKQQCSLPSPKIPEPESITNCAVTQRLEALPTPPWELPLDFDGSILHDRSPTSGQLFYDIGAVQSRDGSTLHNPLAAGARFPDQYLRCDIRPLDKLAKARLFEEIVDFEASPHDMTKRLADVVTLTMCEVTTRKRFDSLLLCVQQECLASAKRVSRTKMNEQGDAWDDDNFLYGQAIAQVARPCVLPRHLGLWSVHSRRSGTELGERPRWMEH